MHRESILAKLNTTRKLLQDIMTRKLRYFGHVTRAGKLSTVILEGLVEGKWSRGRQRRRWLDDIREWTGLSSALLWPETGPGGEKFAEQLPGSPTLYYEDGNKHRQTDVHCACNFWTTCPCMYQILQFSIINSIFNSDNQHTGTVEYIICIPYIKA